MTSAHGPNPTSGTEPPAGEARLLPRAVEFVAFSFALVLLGALWRVSYLFAGLFCKEPCQFPYWATPIGFAVVWLHVVLRTDPRRGLQVRSPGGGWSLSASPEFVAFTAALVFLAALWASPFFGPVAAPDWAPLVGFPVVGLLVALMWWPGPK